MARSRTFTSALSLSAATFGVLALAACAGGPGGPGGHGGEQGLAYQHSTFLSGAALLMVQFDTDKDYVTTRTEAEAGARAEWARVTHGPTGMTPIQFETWSAAALGGPTIGPRRLAFDSNVDNLVTEQEFIDGILRQFDKYDANKDGRVTRAEMVERLPERFSRPGGPGGEQQGGPGEGRPRR